MPDVRVLKISFVAHLQLVRNFGRIFSKTVLRAHQSWWLTPQGHTLHHTSTRFWLAEKTCIFKWWSSLESIVLRHLAWCEAWNTPISPDIWLKIRLSLLLWSCVSRTDIFLSQDRRCHHSLQETPDTINLLVRYYCHTRVEHSSRSFRSGVNILGKWNVSKRWLLNHHPWRDLISWRMRFYTSSVKISIFFPPSRSSVGLGIQAWHPYSCHPGTHNIT